MSRGCPRRARQWHFAARNYSPPDNAPTAGRTGIGGERPPPGRPSTSNVANDEHPLTNGANGSGLLTIFRTDMDRG